MSDKLVFDLTPAAQPVELDGESYVLTEASSSAAAMYRNAISRATKLGPDGKPVSFGDGFAEADLILLSLCIFKTGNNGSRSAVPIDQVRHWPERVVSQLVDCCQKMSGLGLYGKNPKVEEEQAKNSSTATG